ncbi:MAG: DUF4091 domain-containing protein [Lentisphaerae bacterium]|jgi:hypothetical protein|nr:DUF4091 domain-containing protein [Lentisphaerota bacterium]MBT5605150.1 DUF4091 domain-containing protein [Lentisphaerota bacterium]MBT7059941.1 DUF4091 domain-containing protein [Lentisphaerota bacterium]MBT7845673.1 DUF4091 domain-containing protein [Lentisphaerota bacterium]
MTYRHRSAVLRLSLLLGTVLFAGRSVAQLNLIANPGFEELGKTGFFSGWGRGEFGKVGKTVFAQSGGTPSGQRCLRLVGTVHATSPWTTCAGPSITVVPKKTYWISWRFKAQQPATSRTYLFLQTNLAQRVFPHTDRRGDVDWTLNIVPYRTRPGETTLNPVLTMMSHHDEVGTSWWDDIGVWEDLPPELEAEYRRHHPWDDVTIPTARRLAATASCLIWHDRPEARVYPDRSPPENMAVAEAVELAAPGGGHDVCQLVVSALQDLPAVRLAFSSAAKKDDAKGLSYRVLGCVPVSEVRDTSFPLGPTPDPLLPADAVDPVEAGRSVVFWIQWAAPIGGTPGVHETFVDVLADGDRIARVPLRLRQWDFDLPSVPHYRSMVLISSASIRRLYPGLSDHDALSLAWDTLSAHRLSGFNLAVWPTAKLVEGELKLDWARFDRVVAAAKHYKASALTLGPMFGGGCSQGWKPGFGLCGFTPLADPGFDPIYIELNRRMAERLRQAGMLDRAYVYPYDEPEPDYMDKIAQLCDLIHRGAPDLKCLMTVNPTIAEPLWGKVQAWISPSSARAEALDRRRTAGDEIWIYNMVAAIENTPLEHRLFMWRVLRANARGGLLWNSCWWNKINPWENPTSAPVPVGRQRERLYRYQAGQASLFYPNPAGKGPLIPSLRLVLVRQGVEDFDMLTQLVTAWRSTAAAASHRSTWDSVATNARAAFIAPVMLDETTITTCAVRVEAIRGIVAAELEVASQAPRVIAYPTRVEGKLGVTGVADPDARLMLNGTPVTLKANGQFAVPLNATDLAAGLRWTAAQGASRKSWSWPGLR